jgi:uncharacterized protein (DUF433 family)
MAAFPWTAALATPYNAIVLEKTMGEHVAYKYLWPKPGSNYRQLFVNGRIRAEILYRETVGPKPLTAEEVAAEYGLPVEAVLEAIDYCLRHRELLDAERSREAERIAKAGRDRWPYAPRDFAHPA